MPLASDEMLTEINHTTKPPTDAENTAMYQRIKSGDASAIPEMIERNMPGVMSRVGTFLQAFPRFSHLQEDLVSEGFLALTKTVQDFVNVTVEKHPSGRVVFEIDRALGNYVDSEVGAGMMSSRSVQRSRAEGEKLPERLLMSTDSPPTNLWTKADGRVLKKQILDENVAPTRSYQNEEADTYSNADKQCDLGRSDAKVLVERFSETDHTASADLLDSILACCECDEDEMIVTLRIKGYTDTEIGEQLNLSQQTVNVRRHSIETRFDARMKALDDE